MSRNPRYDILFEPVRIGPKTAKNRFYQVPHCTGMGFDLPHSVARLREIKAEGGWGVVNTEYCSLHWSSEDAPYRLCALWDENDVRIQSMTVEKIHGFGALAGVELWHGGNHAPNRASRETPLSPSGSTQHAVFPQQTRAMDREDIRNLRRWQVDAAKRAMRAGFDIVYCYAGHGYLPFQFITRRWNQRSDEYGGSIENRMRFPLAVFSACRKQFPSDKPIAVRISAADWAPGGLSGEDLVALTRMLKDAGCDLVDCSTGQTVPQQRPVYGRMYQAPFADWVRNETGIATMTVGAITTADQVNTLLASGKADIVALGRPHLADPYFTLQASAWYQDAGQHWPPQYLPGRDQAYRNAARERAEFTELRLKARPASHEVKDAP